MSSTPKQARELTQVIEQVFPRAAPLIPEIWPAMSSSTTSARLRSAGSATRRIGTHERDCGVSVYWLWVIHARGNQPHDHDEKRSSRSFSDDSANGVSAGIKAVRERLESPAREV
jgi:hypothetical protein